MAGADVYRLVWRKSARSGENGGNCVEVAAFSSGVAVRDSKNPLGPVLVFSLEEWGAFLNALRRGGAIS